LIAEVIPQFETGLLLDLRVLSRAMRQDAFGRHPRGPGRHDRRGHGRSRYVRHHARPLVQGPASLHDLFGRWDSRTRVRRAWVWNVLAAKPVGGRRHLGLGGAPKVAVIEQNAVRELGRYLGLEFPKLPGEPTVFLPRRLLRRLENDPGGRVPLALCFDVQEFPVRCVKRLPGPFLEHVVP
jgi:hypothetical protein